MHLREAAAHDVAPRVAVVAAHGSVAVPVLDAVAPWAAGTPPSAVATAPPPGPSGQVVVVRHLAACASAGPP